MSTNARGYSESGGVTLGGLRFAIFTTRNLVFLIAVLAMNYTLMRPSPVDLLFVLSFLMTLVHIALFARPEVSRRPGIFSLVVGVWAVSFLVASLPYLNEPFVAFELLSKVFAISIGVTAAFVSMTWNGRHVETFMKVYIASCVVAAILGTIGFVLQTELLTWDGRAKGFIDDPNMYGSFLIPAVLFCAYFLFRPSRHKLVLTGALLVVLLGIVLSFSRVAVVAVLICLFAYVAFHNRRNPRRLLMMAGGLVVAGIAVFAVASLTSGEFTEKLLDRLTFAKSYDLGEDGRYGRYLQVLPMIIENPLGLGVLQLDKIFPEPIHNIWLSSFVNYGWGGGFSWVTLVIASVVISIRNYRRTQSDLPIIFLASLIGIIMCASLHEGEHWRQMWLLFGLVWGVNVSAFGAGPDKPRNAPVRQQAAKRPGPRRAAAQASRAPTRAPAAAAR